MKISLAARVAVLVCVLTMAGVAVAAFLITLTSQQVLDSALQRHEADIHAGIVKDLNEAGTATASWEGTTATAEGLARTYDVRIVVTSPGGVVFVDTGSGPLPPLIGILEPLPEPAMVYIGSTLAVSTPLPVWFAVATVIVLASGLLAIPLARGLTRPLATVGEAVEAIREGDLGARAQVTSPPEIATLATGVNEMAAELQAGELRRRQLTADIAHELRSPLTNIRNHLDAFDDGLLELTPSNLSTLDSETERLSTLVEDLAVVASLDEGTLRVHLQPVDLAAVVDSALDARRVQAVATGITLTRLGECGEVVIDPDRTAQILGNLLDNALRHTPRGGTVAVRIESYDAPVDVHVTDTGSGIATDDLPHVFDRLWRGDTARGHSGHHGLGLAVARGLALAQGGSLHVVNLPQQGCDFTLTLPVAGH